MNTVLEQLDSDYDAWLDALTDTEEARASTYNRLVSKSLAEWTSPDYADWYTATGWHMPRSTYTPKLRTVQQLWSWGTR